MVELLTVSTGLVGATDPVYVDFNYVDWEAGTFAEPFDALYEVVVFVKPGDTIYLKSANTSEPVKIHGRMKIMRSGP